MWCGTRFICVQSASGATYDSACSARPTLGAGGRVKRVGEPQRCHKGRCGGRGGAHTDLGLMRQQRFCAPVPDCQQRLRQASLQAADGAEATAAAGQDVVLTARSA